jgi:hypothetical protein
MDLSEHYIRVCRIMVGLVPDVDPGSPVRTPSFEETQLAAYHVWQLVGEPMNDDVETVTIWLSAQEVLRYLPEPYPIPAKE